MTDAAATPRYGDLAMTREELDAFLAQADTIMLASLRRDGSPFVIPVGFDWDGEFVRLSTLKSRVKYRNLVANPQITFCVVDPQMPTRYLEIRGYAEITDDPEGTLNRKMFRRMSGREFDLDEPGAERVIVKIVPTQVSAPALYGGRLDRRAAEVTQSGTPLQG